MRARARRGTPPPAPAPAPAAAAPRAARGAGTPARPACAAGRTRPAPPPPPACGRGVSGAPGCAQPGPLLCLAWTLESHTGPPVGSCAQICLEQHVAHPYAPQSHSTASTLQRDAWVQQGRGGRSGAACGGLRAGTRARACSSLELPPADGDGASSSRRRKLSAVCSRSSGPCSPPRSRSPNCADACDAHGDHALRMFGYVDAPCCHARSRPARARA